MRIGLLGGSPRQIETMGRILQTAGLSAVPLGRPDEGVTLPIEGAGLTCDHVLVLDGAGEVTPVERLLRSALGSAPGRANVLVLDPAHYGTMLPGRRVFGEAPEEVLAAIHELCSVPVGQGSTRVLGCLRLVRRLGKGGMGVVWEAEDLDYGRRVALKTLSSDEVRDPARLKAEFRAAAELSHPNLVRLYELSHDQDTWYFTMELVHGPDLVNALRGAPTAHVRAVFAQVAAAVRALHRSGLVHLDIKPGNLLLETAAGRDRAVLLDFGISRRLDDGPDARGEPRGTPRYMAPERFAALPATSACDWYSVGVTLFEVLTGSHAQGRDGRELGGDLRHVPADLAGLCVHLLSRDPKGRAGWAEVSATLGVPEATWSASGPSTLLFGRDEDLRGLLARWEGLSERGSMACLLRGRSGIGKTALLRTFVDLLRARYGALVLDGRCFERESIPFRALDGVLTSLANHLLRGRLVSGEVEARLGEVAVISPGLVPGALPAPSALDPRTRLERAAAALAQVLDAASQQRPVVVCIDDVQWGDEDSALLLAQLLGRDAGTPVLLVGTWFAADDRPEPAFVEVLRRRLGERLEVTELGPLSESDSRLLARTLLAPEVAEDEVGSLVCDAEGNPYFLCALAAAGRATGVQSWLRATIGELDPVLRSVLELVALAGRPVSLDLVDHAGLDTDPVAGTTLLANRQLLRIEGVRRGARVECWHSRVRLAALEALAEPARREHHRRLAQAYAATGTGSADLRAHHHHGAGEVEIAADLSEQAAAEARERLAFGRAAELWEQAARWAQEAGPVLSARNHVRRRKQADCLVLAGHRASAAELFLELAAEAPDAAGLRREAAGHLLASGHVERGAAQLVPMLRERGIVWPSTDVRALARIGGELARLAAFGPRRRAPRRDAEQQTRATLCWHAARGLLSTDALRGMYFSVLGLRAALASGDPDLGGRLLAVVGSVMLAPAGGPLATWGRRMLARAEALAAEHPGSLLEGVVAVGRCQERVLAGDWPAALEWAGVAEDALGGRVCDVAWELDVARMGALRANEEMGRFVQSTQDARAFSERSRERQDLYGEVTGLLYEGSGRLALGDVAAARQCAARIRELWAFAGFHVQHLYAMRIEAGADLDAGEVAESWRRLGEAWPQLVASGLLRLSIVQFDAWELRARLALARGELAEARRSARRLVRRPEPHAQTWGAALLARAGAAGDLRAIALRLELVHMPARAACARWAAARDEAERRAAEEALRGLGVADPRRWARSQLPDAQAPVQQPR